MSSRFPSSSSPSVAFSALWRSALAAAQHRLSNTRLACRPEVLRQTMIDARAEGGGGHWTHAMRIFDTALLSGHNIDAATFREACATCRCSQCVARRRCTGVALLAVAEASGARSVLGPDVLRLARASELWQHHHEQKNQQQQNSMTVRARGATTATSFSSMRSQQDEDADDVLNEWRLLETTTTSSSSSSSASWSLQRMTHLVVSTVDQLRLQPPHQQRRMIGELAAYSPTATRFAFWGNIWRFSADRFARSAPDEIAVDVATFSKRPGGGGLAGRGNGKLAGGGPRPSSSTSTWIPAAESESGAEIVAALRRRCDAQSSLVMIPSTQVLLHSRGLTRIAELSRSAEILLPASVVARALLLATSTAATDNGGGGGGGAGARRALRSAMKVLFPADAASPPRKVVVLPFVDELRLRSDYFSSRSSNGDDVPELDEDDDAALIASCLRHPADSGANQRSQRQKAAISAAAAGGARGSLENDDFISSLFAPQPAASEQIKAATARHQEDRFVFEVIRDTR